LWRNYVVQKFGEVLFLGNELNNFFFLKYKQESFPIFTPNYAKSKFEHSENLFSEKFGPNK
jgi:hypothetical protein